MQGMEKERECEVTTEGVCRLNQILLFILLLSAVQQLLNMHVCKDYQKDVVPTK